MLRSAVTRPLLRQFNGTAPRLPYRQAGSPSFDASANLSKFSQLPLRSIRTSPLASAPRAGPNLRPRTPFAWCSTRHKSTQAAPPAADPNSSFTLEPLPGSPADTSTTWFEDLDAKIPDATPHIGYLHEAGIDFGWGPTSVVQWTMEHIHILSGFEWWGTLLASAAVFRIAMLYPTIMSSDTMARMGHIRPQLDKINEEVKRLQDQGKTTEALAYRQTETKALKEFAGASTTGLWLPLAIQIPLGFGTFRFLRSLSATPNIGIETGGALWFPDLSIPDPYYVLPVAMAVWMHLFARLGNRGAAGGISEQPLSPFTRNLMLYFLPALSFAVIMWQPSALQLVFAATSLSQIMIAALLKQPSVRGRLGIAQLPKVTAQSQQKVMQEMMDMWKTRKPKDNTPPPIPRSERTIYMSEAKAAQDRLRKAKLEEKRRQRGA